MNRVNQISDAKNKNRKRKKILLTAASIIIVVSIGFVIAVRIIDTPKYTTVYDINGKVYQQLSEGAVYSYFTDAVYTQVLGDLVKEYHYSYDTASNMILNGRLKIYSTVDPDIQKALEDQAANTGNFPAQSRAAQEASEAKSAETNETINYIPQLGGAVIENSTGYVAGIIGGRNKPANLAVDRALNKFQTSATTAPLTVYAPGINENLFTLDMVLNNKTPVNDFSSAVSFFEKIDIDTAADYGEKFGLDIRRSGKVNDMNPAALALGGYTYGQTPLAVASAYTVFPNRGTRSTPAFYTKVEDSKGNVILTAQQTHVQVITAETAYQVTAILQDAVQGAAAARSISGQQIGGMTGTDNNKAYVWFTGFTSRYTASFWFGYDERIVSADGKNYELNIGIDPNDAAGPAQYWESVFRQFYASKKLPDAELPDKPQ